MCNMTDMRSRNRYGKQQQQNTVRHFCKPHQNGCECRQDVTENGKYKGHVLLRKEGDPGGYKETQAEMPQKFTKGQVRNCATWHESVHRKKEWERRRNSEKIRAGAPELVYLNRKTCSDLTCTDPRQNILEPAR